MKSIAVLFCCSILFSNCSSNTDNVNVYVAKYKEDKLCAISYTYDDGMKEHYTLVFPEMEKRKMKGTFWVNGISINIDNEAVRDTGRASWPELKEMAIKGHEISNHGWSHANLTKISPDEVKVEIGKNDSIILANTGIPSRTFCYPYNARNEEVTALASEGRVGTRTRQFAMSYKLSPEDFDRWVNTLLETKDWGVAMIHGITYGYDAFTSPDILWNHFDQVKALEDSIWVGTFHDVGAYLKEFEELECEITRKGSKITITPHLALDKELFNEPLTMVVEEEGLKKVSAIQGEKELTVRSLPGKAMFEFDPYGGIIEVKVK
ncbi:polysaccharide deacetylase family protein [Bacteroides sp. 51]|nr:polysaccharide deacetylase family protein [Bacteroides sp. 51]